MGVTNDTAIAARTASTVANPKIHHFRLRTLCQYSISSSVSGAGGRAICGGLKFGSTAVSDISLRLWNLDCLEQAFFDRHGIAGTYRRIERHALPSCRTIAFRNQPDLVVRGAFAETAADRDGLAHIETHLVRIGPRTADLAFNVE